MKETSPMPPRFWDVARADLFANTGQTSLKQAFGAFLFKPGFAAIFLHRFARQFVRTWLDKFGVLIWAWNTNRSGCHFHLDSEIAPGLCLPHPVAIVIGTGVRVGPNATIYQSVTIGKLATSEEYPVIGRDVVIYPGAIIIGAINVGDRAVIGAGSIVIKDVPADAVVAGNPARILRSGAKSIDAASTEPPNK